MPQDMNYYPEEGETEDMESEAEPSDSGEEEGGSTALIPKSLLAGKEFKPGDEIVLQVVRIYEDEVEVQYASETKEEAPSTSSPEDELDAMARSPGEY